MRYLRGAILRFYEDETHKKIVFIRYLDNVLTVGFDKQSPHERHTSDGFVCRYLKSVGKQDYLSCSFSLLNTLDD